MFRVRGPNYLKDGKKINSERSLCRLLAVDFLEGPLGTDFTHIASKGEGVMHSFLEKHRHATRAPFVIIINFQIQFASDSSGCMAFYWVRREEAQSDGADALFRRLMNDEAENRVKLDEEACGCVKVIPIVRNGPWLVKRVMGAEKPAIIGKKIALEINRGLNYMEVGIDTTTSTAGNAIISVLKEPLTTLVIDLAFMFEGKAAEFLPERLLGTVRLSHLEVPKAVRVENFPMKRPPEPAKSWFG